MTTGTNLGVQAAARFRDSGNVVVGATQWLAYCNQAYQFANSLTPYWPWNESDEQSVTVLANTRSIAMPSDMWQVNWVYNSTDDYRMVPQEGRGDQWHQDHLRSEVGQPVTYKIRATKLEVFPMPNVDTTFKIEGMAYPAILTSGSPIWPAQFHELLLDGMLALAYLDDGNKDWYDTHWAKFVAAVSRMRDDMLAHRTETYVPIRDSFWS